MQEILRWLHIQNQSIIEFETINPDIGEGKYAGSIIEMDGIEYRHRSYKAWNDLAELIFYRMLTPKLSGRNTIIIRYQKIDLSTSFHNTRGKEEKYGVDSQFFIIEKNEEPAFISAYIQALNAVKISKRNYILNLGINRGDEFKVINSLLGNKLFLTKKLVGVDHSISAIEVARERFKSATFYVEDINKLNNLKLERADLIISIGTLQSSGINFKPLFMSLIQNHLKSNGAIILGFPNCRWMGGEMIYGAKAPNYNYSEQSILYNDVIFCKKYLQQKKFRVTLTGKNYLFLTATKIGVSN